MSIEPMSVRSALFRPEHIPKNLDTPWCDVHVVLSFSHSYIPIFQYPRLCKIEKNMLTLPTKPSSRPFSRLGRPALRTGFQISVVDTKALWYILLLVKYASRF